ncbi:MAG: hypothetical protein II529_02225 [Erysipelotrichaceae bacterium]|nr:hypothetical protein [Erysipelotrichaceae bacterium]MBQ2583367.1 hypothetical protein [Erysipelotrichaceae bacterium]
MRKMRDVSEAFLYLKEGEILTSDGKDQFVLKQDRIYRYDRGTRFSLPAEDFLQLYQKSSFFLYEETAEIDETKDEAYYRYYRK